MDIGREGESSDSIHFTLLQQHTALNRINVGANA